MQVIEYGGGVRSTGATGVNSDSSRSHAILQLDVKVIRNEEHVGRYIIFIIVLLLLLLLIIIIIIIIIIGIVLFPLMGPSSFHEKSHGLLLDG